MTALTAEPAVDLEALTTRFRACLEDFGERCARHRYAVRIHVTSGYRDGDKGSHGFREGVDIRGWGPAWEPSADLLQLVRKRRPTLDAPDQRDLARQLRYLQLAIWLTGMWVATCRDHGFGPEQWAIGVYPLTDGHLHLDVRPHVGAELYAATWVGESG